MTSAPRTTRSVLLCYTGRQARLSPTLVEILSVIRPAVNIDAARVRLAWLINITGIAPATVTLTSDALLIELNVCKPKPLDRSKEWRSGIKIALTVTLNHLVEPLHILVHGDALRHRCPQAFLPEPMHCFIQCVS